jgi:hypothetical protein
MLTDALVDLWRISLYPAKDGRVIYVEASLTHHLFDIAIRELVSALTQPATVPISGSDAPSRRTPSRDDIQKKSTKLLKLFRILEKKYLSESGEHSKKSTKP